MATIRTDADKTIPAFSSPGKRESLERKTIAPMGVRRIRCAACNIGAYLAADDREPRAGRPCGGWWQQQVDNVALAVKERRELDKEEKAELDRAMDRAWANLPPQYQFLKNWEYV